MGVIYRLGLALVQPRAALALAGDRRAAGRAGSDLLVAIALLVVATELRALVGAVWLAWAVDVTLGGRALVQTLSGALALDLGVLVVAALAAWLGAGPRREVGRSFDVACVAVVPLVALQLVITVIAQPLGAPPMIVSWIVTGAAFAWTGALVALAIAELRRGARVADAGAPAARRAGIALVVAAGAGVALQTVWVVQHVELVRPMVTGEIAPPLALPAIGPHGALGGKVTLDAARGKPVVVDFWATWCKPCLAALPALDKLARAHPDIAVYAVDLDDPVAARELFDARGYTPTLLADDGDTSERYGVSTIPHTVVIDRAGFVRRVARGGLDLEAELGKLGLTSAATGQ